MEETRPNSVECLDSGFGLLGAAGLDCQLIMGLEQFLHVVAGSAWH